MHLLPGVWLCTVMIKWGHFITTCSAWNAGWWNRNTHLRCWCWICHGAVRNGRYVCFSASNSLYFYIFWHFSTLTKLAHKQHRLLLIHLFWHTNVQDTTFPTVKDLSRLRGLFLNWQQALWSLLISQEGQG